MQCSLFRNASFLARIIRRNQEHHICHSFFTCAPVPFAQRARELWSNSPVRVSGRNRRHETRSHWYNNMLDAALGRRTKYAGLSHFDDGSKGAVMDISEEGDSASQKLSWVDIYRENSQSLTIDDTSVMTDIDMEDQDVQDIHTFLANNRYPEPQRFVPSETTKISAPTLGQSQVNGAASSNGEHSALFHLQCAQRGKTMEVKYLEVKPQQFTAKIIVDEVVMGEVGPHPSKKAAKEECCRLALSTLEKTFPPRVKQQKAAAVQDELQSPLSDIVAENWIGQLVEYTQAKRQQYPIYRETAKHSTMGPFACTVMLPSMSAKQFGDGDAFFGQKSQAKKAAAMSAVLWLRTMGLLHSNNQTDIAVHDATNQSGNVQLAVLRPKNAALETEGTDTETPQYRSTAEHAQALANSLGITPPRYQMTPLMSGFCQMHALFELKDAQLYPELAGEVGKVDRAYGQKGAKQECARHMVRLLEDIKRRQEASTNSLI